MQESSTMQLDRSRPISANDNLAQLKQQRLDILHGNATKKDTNVSGAIFKTQSDFINYLTSMLKNRTPEDNFDMAQMAGIFATMGAAQQTFAMGEKMDAMRESQKMHELLQTVNQVGKVAEIKGNIIDIGEGKSTTIKYKPTENTEAVRIVLHDLQNEGKVVVDMTSGKLDTKDKTDGVTMNWDGSFNGKKISRGLYQIEVRALDKNGHQIFDKQLKKPVTLNTSIIDKVTGATNRNGNINISMGNANMPLSSLLSIYESLPEQPTNDKARTSGKGNPIISNGLQQVETANSSRADTENRNRNRNRNGNENINNISQAGSQNLQDQEIREIANNVAKNAISQAIANFRE